MNRFVPLAAFEHDGQAVIAVDADASIQLCNSAARRLLGVTPGECTSGTCWGFASFRTLDGRPFCGPDCPVQSAAKEGRPGAQHWVVPTKGSCAGRPVEIVSFFVPGEQAGRRAVLHFLRPAHLPVATNAAARPFDLEAAGHISEREAEVLRLLADGLSTAAIARALGITNNTVRNHLGNIFHKLGVHGRIEALAAFTRTVAEATDQGHAEETRGDPPEPKPQLPTPQAFRPRTR
jgi:DNA-binding CsgD family transcriptional regulator